MPADGYKAVRLRRETYEEIMAIKRRIAAVGVANMPEALKMDVNSISDVVDIMVRATRKAIG